jgi:hypothetical protein
MFQWLTSNAQLFQSSDLDLHGAPPAPFPKYAPGLHGGVRPPIPDVD